jgi:hypothetical protein
MIKTGNWWTQLPADHLRIGISRGVPRNQQPGYRMYRKLAPGPWFNSLPPDEYTSRYHDEVLARLDPQAVAAELAAIAGGRIPVLVCFERPNAAMWCHRSLAASWLHDALGEPIPEFGYEELPQHLHPCRYRR